MVAPKVSSDDLSRIIAENPKASNYDLAKKVSNEYQVDHRSIRRRLSRLRDAKNVNGASVYGTSTLYDENGDVKLQWVKQKQDNFEEQAKAYVQDLIAPVAPVKPRKAPRNTHKDLMACILMGDPHVGMLAWDEETGDNFDLKIAEADLRGAVNRLVESAPDASECLIANLGDYFHMDDRLNATPGSKNPLDVDGRYLKVMRVGIRTMKALIERALEKFPTVRVRNVAGNHDPHSSITLTLTLSALYEKEPRVVIEDSPSPFWTFKFGQSLIGLTHGHQLKKPETMAQFLAVHDPKGWGSTQYRHVWHGHIHHKRVQEVGGVVVESFRTLAGPDAWHVAEGYKAGREMVSIILDRNYGEIERHTSSLERSRHT